MGLLKRFNTRTCNPPHPPISYIKDDYLQQNSFTKYDKYCPFYKSVEMMRNIATFHRLATAAVEKTASGALCCVCVCVSVCVTVCVCV